MHLLLTISVLYGIDQLRVSQMQSKGCLGKIVEQGFETLASINIV